jgi:tetratricopeptide (TPR) repeat protein
VLEERALRPSEVLAVLAELDAELLSESEAVAFLGLGGRAHFALGMFEQAEEWFNRLVERAPEDAAAWQWWGVSHYQLQSYEAALEAFLSAERHAPREVGVWRNLAAALTALERYAEAEGWYLRILEVHADDAHALHHLAWLRAAAGDADEAERLWLRACQLGYAPACDVR